MTVNKGENGWHVDRAVRIDLIVMLALQIIGATYFLSNMNARLDNNEQAIQRLADVPDRITRVEANLGNTMEIVKDVRDRLWSNSAQAHPLR